MNKKGISTDAFVIVLLVIGLALAIGLVVYFAVHSGETSAGLWNISRSIKEVG